MIHRVPVFFTIILSIPSVFASVPGEEDIFSLIRQGEIAAVRKLVADKPEVLVTTEIVGGNDTGQTPLHRATALNQEEIVEVLIEAGANPVAASRSGITSIHIAAGRCETNILRLLVGKRKELPRDDGGSSPLYYAVREGKTENVRFLLSRGADVHEVRMWGGDGDNAEPLITCAAHDPELISLLVGAGADIDTVGRGGKTLLYLLCETDLRDFGGETDPRERALACIESVLKLGADSGIAETVDGWTPLHAAVWFQNEDAVVALLKGGASVKAKAADGRTPVDFARRQKFAEIEKILLAHTGN